MTLKKYTTNINSAEKSQKQHVRVSSTGKPFSAGKGAGMRAGGFGPGLGRAQPVISGEEPFYMFRLGGKSYRVQDTAEVPKIAKKMGYKIIYQSPTNVQPE